MTETSLPEPARVVKDKRRTRRTVPPGVALTVADIEKLETRYQGPKKNPALYIKRAFQTYIEKAPGLTSTTKRVACFLVDWYRLRDGYARPPISRIAKELAISNRSAERAVAILHKLKLIFVKSGGPTRRQGFGTIASRYVPNFWLVINRDTGAVIGNAKYEFVPLNPIDGAGDYRQDGGRGAYRQDGGRGKPLKPIDGAGDYRQDGGRYVSTRADAHATPSADAPGYAPAPLKKASGILPPDSENVKIKFIRLEELALYTGMHPDQITDYFDDGVVEDHEVNFFTNWCQDESAGNTFPPNGSRFGHVIIHGDQNPVTWDHGESGEIDLQNLQSADWMAVEYRI